MQKLYKPLRIAIALFTFLSLSFIFLDINPDTNPLWYRIITWWQFVPSANNFIRAAEFLSAGFIVVIILTLLFGRIYCSMFCPLGIFQDIIHFFSKKLNKKKLRFKYAHSKKGLRYLFLALAVIPLFLGSITFLGLLDPYSNFGRIFAGLFKPVYLILHNITGEILMKMHIYSVPSGELIHASLKSIIYPFIILGLITWLSAKWGRLYCNTICPVGTFLGFLSKISLFKIKIDQTKCIKCAKCCNVCKSQCIDLKTQKIDFTRCVGCFDCIDKCEHNAIGFHLSLTKKTQPGKNDIPQKKDIPQNQKTDQSKRKFFGELLLFLFALAGISAKSEQQKKHQYHNRDGYGKGRENGKGHGTCRIEKNNPCSPPGSISLKHFNNTCTACNLCVAACPGGVLQPSFLQYGLEGFLQPYMDSEKGYCSFDCTKCSEICPCGAILPLSIEKKHTTQIGIAHFVIHNCVVFREGTLCGACAEHCPTKAITMIPYGKELNIPQVDSELCIGCGACEHVCPADPKAIFVEGNIIHLAAKKPVQKKQKEGSLEEFPF